MPEWQWVPAKWWETMKWPFCSVTLLFFFLKAVTEYSGLSLSAALPLLLIRRRQLFKHWSRSWFVLEIGLHYRENWKITHIRRRNKEKTQAKRRLSLAPNLPAYSRGSIGRLITVWNAAIHSFWSSSVSHVNRNFLSGVTMVMPCCQWWPWTFWGRPGSTV